MGAASGWSWWLRLVCDTAALHRIFRQALTSSLDRARRKRGKQSSSRKGRSGRKGGWKTEFKPNSSAWGWISSRVKPEFRSGLAASEWQGTPKRGEHAASTSARSAGVPPAAAAPVADATHISRSPRARGCCGPEGRAPAAHQIPTLEFGLKPGANEISRSHFTPHASRLTPHVSRRPLLLINRQEVVFHRQAENGQRRGINLSRAAFHAVAAPPRAVAILFAEEQFLGDLPRP